MRPDVRTKCARFHHETAKAPEPRIKRSARPAACQRVDCGISKTSSAAKRPSASPGMTTPDKRASCRSLRPLTRSAKPPSLTRSTISTTAPQISLHDLTPDQRPPDRLDLHTHRNHRITIVLSSSSRPLANPNLHAFRCSLNASKSPPEHHYLQTPKPSSHHPSSPPLIIINHPSLTLPLTHHLPSAPL